MIQNTYDTPKSPEGRNTGNGHYAVLPGTAKTGVSRESFESITNIFNRRVSEEYEKLNRVQQTAQQFNSQLQLGLLLPEEYVSNMEALINATFDRSAAAATTECVQSELSQKADVVKLLKEQGFFVDESLGSVETRLKRAVGYTEPTNTPLLWQPYDLQVRQGPHPFPFYLIRPRAASFIMKGFSEYWSVTTLC